VIFERFQKSPIGSLVPISGHDPRYDEPFTHWAYVPDPLPETLVLTSHTWTIVAEAMQALGRLDQVGDPTFHKALIRRSALRREAHSTSTIEGTVAPLSLVLEIDPHDTAKKSKEIVEIMNYVSTAEYAYEHVNERPITFQLLNELHKLLVSHTASDGTDTGKVRSQQVVIGSPTGRVVDARFVPHPPGPDLEIQLRSWLEWVNQERTDMPPVVAAALAHYQFETIHPFNDGNGRLGRLLVVLQLVRLKVLREPLLTISPWFEERRDQYQDELLHLSATGDFDRWVRFFSMAVRDQAIESSNKIEKLIKYEEVVRIRCRAHNVRGVAWTVALMLIERPYMTSTWIQKHFAISAPAANAVLAKLVNIGILRETTGGNYRRLFVADEILQIIES
jgi:Fic family protein